MSNEYIIVNKSAIQKIDELVKEANAGKTISSINSQMAESLIRFKEQLLSQSTPLIPVIEKAYDKGRVSAEVDSKEQRAKLLTEIMEADAKDGLYEDHIGDTNKMVTMKLYTEEQVRQSFIAGMEFIAVDPLKYEQDANEYMNTITPIELPSDEEIDEESPYVPNDASIDFWSHKEGFVDGAKWMRDKILNK